MININVFFYRECKGRSFTATVLAEADKLLTSSSTLPPDLSIQDTAFRRFSRHKNTTVLKTACRFFRLSGPRYTAAIRQFAAAGEFKQACDCACALELYDVFDARIFCLPLLLEERLTTAEAYFERSPRALGGLMKGAASRDLFNIFLR
jgi:hypothetical protein